VPLINGVALPALLSFLLFNYSQRFRVENVMEVYTLPRNQLHAVILACQSLAELKIRSNPIGFAEINYKLKVKLKIRSKPIGLQQINYTP